jgi:hypothetical protein
MPLDQTACRDGLRAIGLPAATGESVFDARCDRSEGDDQRRPAEKYGPAVLRRPAAETSEYAESVG